MPITRRRERLDPGDSTTEQGGPGATRAAPYKQRPLFVLLRSMEKLQLPVTLTARRSIRPT